MTKQLLIALLIAGVSISVRAFNDDGKEVKYEALCSASYVSYVHPSFSETDEREFTFVLKVKPTQVWLSRPSNTFFSSISGLGWSKVTDMISYTAWKASGIGGAYISSMDDDLFFSKLDQQKGFIFSFMAKCNALK